MKGNIKKHIFKKKISRSTGSEFNFLYFDILGLIIRKHKFTEQNYVSLIFFLNSASAWDFPSPINFFFSCSLRPDCLVCV